MRWRLRRPHAKRDLARQSGADHARLDRAVVSEPARMRVAITFDQTCAFGDFQCQLGGIFAASRISQSQSSICCCSCL